MKKIKVINHILVSVLFLGLLFVPIEKHFAAGAEVSVQGEITLFDEETSTSISSTEVPGTSTSSSDSSKEITKPKGQMPSTGESIKKSITISGILLILIICLVYVMKKHYQNNRKEQ